MPLPRFEKLPTARQQAIYDAALEELSAHGPAASVNRILAACAVSKGALYYYFADRDDLLRSAITDRIDAFLAAMRAEVRPPQTVAAFSMSRPSGRARRAGFMRAKNRTNHCRPGVIGRWKTWR